MYYEKLKNLIYSGKLPDLKESLNLYIKLLKQKNTGEFDYDLLTVEEFEEIYEDLNQSTKNFLYNEPDDSINILDEKLSLLNLLKEIVQFRKQA